MPPRIWRTLLAAWSTQQRWLCTPQHAPDAPDLCQALPQGDPMSPLGLIIPLAEATARIKNTYPTSHHTVYMDDRSWMTKQPLQCAQIARSWEQEAQYLGLRENEGKKDFGATGGIHNRRSMAATLQALDITGTVRERPKLLGTYIQTTRAYTGPTEAESARLQQATKLCHLAKALPITTKEKLYYAKSTLRQPLDLGPDSQHLLNYRNSNLQSMRLTTPMVI